MPTPKHAPGSMAPLRSLVPPSMIQRNLNARRCPIAHDRLEIARKLKERTERFADEKPRTTKRELLQEILPMSLRLEMPSDEYMPGEVLCLRDIYGDDTRFAHKLLAILNYEVTLESKPELHVNSAKMRSLNRCTVCEMISCPATAAQLLIPRAPSRFYGLEDVYEGD